MDDITVQVGQVFDYVLQAGEYVDQRLTTAYHHSLVFDNVFNFQQIKPIPEDLPADKRTYHNSQI